MKFSTPLLSLLAATTAAASLCDSEQQANTPSLCKILDLSQTNPEVLADQLAASELSTVMSPVPMPETPTLLEDSDALPVVIAHGMGDSCFNRGMQSITEAAGAKVGAYSVCIPTGDSRIKDTIAGFLTNMDDSVDIFAEKVRADPKLANGFNAFGLSQGNNLIRGYIQKYNDPPVNTFMSICGINAGVGAFPSCSPQGKIGGICKGEE
jgi:palmitoyl-protein thioesterase|tara:strand:- start:20 stop:646 length:627 start_codon:yes stop_codon:yes gene_type:complete